MHLRRSLIATSVSTALAVLVVSAAPVHGAGFALIEQGVSGLGNAYAGGAAVADDATTVFFNPAGMTRLDGKQVTVAGHYIMPQADFSDGGSFQVLPVPPYPVPGPIPIGGPGSDDAGLSKFVPNAYYTQKIDEHWSWGIGLSVPFGLATEYDDRWVGRYHAQDSELKTVNIQPSVAYRFDNGLSLGVGVDVQYIEATLETAIDLGLLLGSPQAADAQGEVEGDDISFGFNVGALYELSDATRIGASFRSKVDHDLEGDGDFRGMGPAGSAALALFQAGGLFVDSDIDASATLPEIASVSIYHELNSKWAVMGDITWTNWDRLDDVVIEFETGSTPDSVLDLQWEDSWRYAVGVTYSPDSRWKWRGGAAYDESPTPNERLRSPRIPDEDRTWVTVGLGYRASDAISFDVAYAHLFVDDADINNTNSTGHVLVGEYDNEVDILSAQLNWSF